MKKKKSILVIGNTIIASELIQKKYQVLSLSNWTEVLENNIIFFDIMIVSWVVYFEFMFEKVKSTTTIRSKEKIESVAIERMIDELGLIGRKKHLKKIFIINVPNAHKSYIHIDPNDADCIETFQYIYIEEIVKKLRYIRT